MRRSVALVAAVLVVAAVAAACAPPKPQPQPPGSLPQGFDACAAPSNTNMATWWRSSPFTSVGIYIGGANRACSQPNLTRTWVTTIKGQGWSMIPIWVGPQASCTPLGGATKIPEDPFWAEVAGLVEADAAADAADALGLQWLDPIYYDMEAYPRGGRCTVAVQRFSSGWVHGLNQRGYLSGFYSSLCSGILDLAAVYDDPRVRRQNAVWIAAWNGIPRVFDFGPPCALSNSRWPNHQRLHQFTGGHTETWGGVTINIDSNAVDGPTTRP